MDEMFQWMKSNFDRHYRGNRAPFGVFIHAAWFLVRDSHFPAYLKLVDYMNSLPDVYLVSVNRAVEFTKNPKSISVDGVEPVEEPLPEEEPEIDHEVDHEVDQEEDREVDQEEGEQTRVIRKRSPVSRRSTQIFDTCQKLPTPSCIPRLCTVRKESVNEERWMTVCGPCPAVYPWLGNPLGLNNDRQ